jgi:hypothetical protein
VTIFGRPTNALKAIPRVAKPVGFAKAPPPYTPSRANAPCAAVPTGKLKNEKYLLVALKEKRKFF